MTAWEILDDIEYNGEPLAKLDRDSVELPNVEIKGTTEKALIVLFKDHGVTRPVPKSQVLPENTINKRGDTGTLMVTRWIGRKLLREFEGDDEGPKKDADDRVEVPGCVCLSETDASVLVLTGDGAEYRLPKSQLRGGDIEHDGDTGTLGLSTWMAKQKGLAK